MKNMNRKMNFKFALPLAVIVLGFAASCGGGKTTETNQPKEADTEAFYETQPLHSGLYDASYYSVTTKKDGKKDIKEKGHFDGRVFFTLSPETSAFYVFENGNRTKINYVVNLEKPFEKNDSGVYVTRDMKQNPVTLTPDSANYLLNFQRADRRFNLCQTNATMRGS